MRECVNDFETASACDLKMAGAWRYAEDPTTEILCYAFIVTGWKEPLVWLPEHGTSGPIGGLLFELAADPDTIFIAHNAGFEKAIWRRIMIPMFGFPDIPNSRWRDTMASCAMRVLPQQLEKALLALRLPHQKDMEGSRLTRAMSKPNRKGYYDRDPTKLARVYEYCRQDIRGEVELWQRLGPLPSGEHAVWLLDQRINERGVRLDMEFVRAAQYVVDRATVPLAEEFRALTGGLEFSQRDKVLAWVREHGAELPDMKAETLDAILGADDDGDQYESLAGEYGERNDPGNGARTLHPSVRRALSIRRLIGSASVKKLRRMAACVCSDGRVRGTLQYHGAGPGRWAGRLLQPQNFPRGSLGGWDPEAVVAAIASRDPETVELVLGKPPVEAVLSALRHSIVASPGRKLVAGDFSGIEARFVLALAGQHDKTALMAAGKDVYLDNAEDSYGVPHGTFGKATHPVERQVGKTSVLGLGFQMGAPKFQAALARVGVVRDLEFCQKVVHAYRKEWAPRVPKLWYMLEDAAVRTVKDRTPHEEYGIRFALEDGFMTVRLPSGRKLWYYDPRPERVLAPWSTPEEPEYKLAYSYRAPKMGQFITIYGFGGLITENVIQACARDLMVSAMFKCEREGLPVVLTVHDEIVGEPEENGPDEKTLQQIMTDVPRWVKDIQVPVSVECWSGERYRK